jgi:dienelactone hydrolase
MDYYLLHSLQPQPEILRQSGIFDRGQLRIHWVARYPGGRGQLPAVLVHPDAGGLAGDMEGICLALARAGYFAAAVHYQRRENLEKKNPLFSWKSPEDVTAVLHLLKADPRVNPDRIGLLGFSKGGMLSLLIASQDHDIKAVVSYYPLADFEEWLDPQKYSFPKSLWIRGIRRYFMKELQVSGWDEALNMLRVASPIHQVEHIQAPVLLVHGAKDLTAPLEQVQRLYQRAQSQGKRWELFIVPRAGHVFNFRDEDQGKIAWQKTMDFLDQYLQGNL